MSNISGMCPLEGFFLHKLRVLKLFRFNHGHKTHSINNNMKRRKGAHLINEKQNH